MANSTRTTLIVLASLIAVVFVGSAYAISGPLPFHLTKVNAESTHDLLVSYAAKDTDGDGLPDWEEVLYGTDPNNAHSVNANVTDSQAVAQGLVKPKFATATTTPIDAKNIPGVSVGPQTLTEQFSQQLLQQYLTNRGATPPTPEQISTLVESGIKNLDASHTVPDSFNAGQVHVAGTGPTSLTSYAVAVAGIFAANTVPASQSELLYFSDAVNKNDATALVKVKAIGTSYGKIATALMKLSVPKEVAGPHLAFANALMHMSEVTLDMAAINTDPLRAMIGLGEYETNGLAVLNALSALNTVFASEGVTITKGQSGYSFYASMLEAAGTQHQP